MSIIIIIFIIIIFIIIIFIIIVFFSTAKIIQEDIDGTQLGRRCHPTLGVVGDVKATIHALLPQLKTKKDDAHLKTSLNHYHNARKGLDKLAIPEPGKKLVHPQYVAKTISELAADEVQTGIIGNTLNRDHG